MAKSKYRKLVGQLRTADEILSQAYRSISLRADDLRKELNEMSDDEYRVLVSFELGDTLSSSHFLIEIAIVSDLIFVEAVPIDSLNASKIHEIDQSIKSLLKGRNENA